jgi:hypothetical protein
MTGEIRMPKSKAVANAMTDKPRRGRPPGSKNKAKMGAGAKPAKSSGAAMMDDLLAFVKSKPSAVFADAKAAMAKAGHGTLYPISWGRALALLGRVKSKPRGQGKAAMASKVGAAGAAADKPRRGRPPGSKNKPKIGAGAAMGAPATVRRGPGRPRKNPMTATSMNSNTMRSRAGSNASSSSIRIADADVMAVQGFVDAVNRGAKVELRYSGDGWALAAG